MCKSKNMERFLDLDFSALSDNFLTSDQLDESETFFPLTVNTCVDCGLCQLGYVVPPELMFNKDYPYDSSTTKMGREHFTKMGIDICDRFNLEKNSLIIEILQWTIRTPSRYPFEKCPFPIWIWACSAIASKDIVLE